MSHGGESDGKKCKETKHGTRLKTYSEPCNNWLITPALRWKRKKSSLFHKLVMLVLEDFGGGLGVVEQLVDFLYLLPLHRLFSLNATQQTGWCQQLHCISVREI